MTASTMIAMKSRVYVRSAFFMGGRWSIERLGCRPCLRAVQVGNVLLEARLIGADGRGTDGFSGCEPIGLAIELP